jgi:hypothetical protein
MSYTYRYTEPMSVVFIGLQKDGKTWEPSKGDTITSPTPINHAFLELVDDKPAKPEPDPVVAPEPPSLPATADGSKEN